jgi:hypothetical protein
MELKIARTLEGTVLIEALTNQLDFDNDIILEFASKLLKFRPNTEDFNNALNNLRTHSDRINITTNLINRLKAFCDQTPPRGLFYVSDVEVRTIRSALETHIDYITDDFVTPLYLDDSSVVSHKKVYMLEESKLEEIRANISERMNKLVAAVCLNNQLN